MAIFELSSPDGKMFEVDAPNAAAAMSAFQKMSAAKPATPAAPGQSMPAYDAAGNATGTETTAAPAPTMGYADQMRNVSGALDKGARMMANGATFGLADKFAGGMDAVTGKAPSYDAGVKAQRAQTQAIRDANPVAAAVSEGVGGLATGAGLIKNGVTLAGRVGAGLLPRVLGYGAEGVLYGGAQGAGNTYSDNGWDYLKNAGKDAAIGGGIGMGLPIAGSIAGAGYRAGSAFLGPRVEGVGRGASALLRGAAQADEAGLRGLGRFGPEAMLPDAGPAMLGLAQGAGTGTGAGRSALIDTLQSRDRETAQRLLRSLDTNLGPAPVPSQVEAGLQSSRRALSPKYNEALDNASAVETPKIIDAIDAMIPNVRGDARSKLMGVRDDLMITDAHGNTGVPDPHPRALLATRQSIDGISKSTLDGNVKRVLGDVRPLIDNELSTKVPGIKSLDAHYQSLKQQSDALEAGQSILDGGKTAIRPSELVDMMRKGGAPQGAMTGPSAGPAMLKQGVRADIDRRVGTNVNDLTQLERTFATPQDWNYKKLGTVFGDGPRDRVAADITATSLGLKAANGIAKLLSGQSNATTRDEVGRLLASQGSDARRLAQLLLNSAQTTGSNARSIAALISSPRWLAATAPGVDHR